MSARTKNTRLISISISFLWGCQLIFSIIEPLQQKHNNTDYKKYIRYPWIADVDFFKVFYFPITHSPPRHARSSPSSCPSPIHPPVCPNTEPAASRDP